MLSNLNSANALFQQMNLFKNLCGVNSSKPLGINWPNESIKALGVSFTYDQTLLYEKNVREKLDNVKKEDFPFMERLLLLNLYSSLN